MPLTTRFQEALVYACQAHAAQKRKGTETPYVSHLLAVTALALENGATEDEAIGALLHDAVEDAGGRWRLKDIRLRFGDTVADIVDGCTDAYGVPKPPWKWRKQHYIDHLPDASESVLLVSCCDKIHNARSIVADLRQDGARVWDRFHGGKKGSLWYYHALLTVYQRSNAPTPLIDELHRLVDEMHRLAGCTDRIV